MPPDAAAPRPRKRSRVRLVPVDWPSLGRLFRAGELPVAEIARRFEIDPKTLHKRAKAEGWVQASAAKPGQHSGPLSPDKQRDGVLALHRRDIGALVRLHGALRAGLERIMAGQDRPNDSRLLTKTGSVIDAFNSLVASQARLIQLHRQAFGFQAVPKDDPQELAERIRAAQREMEAMIRVSPDVPLDGASIPSGSERL
ncbi:MAG: hypothetical protein WDN69_09980 [Aliidongia sp.]